VHQKYVDGVQAEEPEL